MCQQCIECKTESNDFIADWDPFGDLMQDEEDAAREKKQKEISECGTILCTWDAKAGKHVSIRIRCKHFDECSTCREWKIGLEFHLLNRLSDAKKLIVSREDEAKLTRKYGKENIRRIPMGENETAFIIQTKDEIGEPLTKQDCIELSQHAIPTAGRRISGKLGTIKKEEEELTKEQKIYRDKHDPEFDVAKRDMKIEFESECEGAPITWDALAGMVHKEVAITEEPKTPAEVQLYVKMLEDKTQEICIRYGMSFCFYRDTKQTLRMSEVDWSWVKYRQKRLIFA